jgi:hypothetical protein
MKLRNISPEPVRRTTESASWTITTPLRNVLPPRSPAVRPAARKVFIKSGREARNAGTSPKMAAAAKLANIVKPRATESMATDSRRGRFSGAMASVVSPN